VFWCDRSPRSSWTSVPRAEDSAETGRPSGWLTDEVRIPRRRAGQPSGRHRRTPPKGVVLSGAGASRASATRPRGVRRRDDLRRGQLHGTYTVGETSAHQVLARGELRQAGDVVADGSGTAYRFSSSLNTQLVNVAGNVGWQPSVRIYGRAGVNYHRSGRTPPKPSTTSR